MIVFIDFDDTMNNAALCRNPFIVESYFHDMTTVEAFDKAITHLFTEEAMEVVRWLCEKYNPKFVISSTWGKDFTKEQFELMFHANKLPIVLHEDWRTDDAGTRYDQIQRWIVAHEDKIHLILDDTQSGCSLEDTPLEFKTVFCDRMDQTDPESHGCSLNNRHKYWIQQTINYQLLECGDE